MSLHRLKFLETLDGLLNGLEVCQQAAEPTLVNVILATAFSFFADSILGLSLCTDKKDRLSSVFRNCIGNKAERIAKHSLSFLQVNNVDAIALAENVFLHLRIPAPNLVAEMHASLQEFFHSNRYQTLISFSVNWFNVLTITPGPLLKSNQFELWQWILEFRNADFEFRILLINSQFCD